MSRNLLEQPLSTTGSTPSGGNTSLMVIVVLVFLAGCHQEMADQARVETYEQAAFFADGSGSRPQVPGTIARGQAWVPSPFTTGMSGQSYVSNPEQATPEQLQLGREQFTINCQHCHGSAGYGDGMVVQRGFPKPPSYHIDRLRNVADGRIFEVITKGHGRMPALGNLISVKNRWAITSYVRVLQLSQHIDESKLTDADRAALSKSSDDRSGH